MVPKNAIANATAGQVVAIELTEAPSLYSQPMGRVTEVLGEIDDPGMEIEIAVRKYEVPHRFSPETLAQSAGLPDKIRPADRKQRIDLTDVPLVTIDEDAYERATSVYFPRRVIPMLPEKLSNGLCSLNPNEDRLAMVCDMLITAAGEIHAYQFFPAMMCSHARFTYTEVAA